MRNYTQPLIKGNQAPPGNQGSGYMSVFVCSVVACSQTLRPTASRFHEHSHALPLVYTWEKDVITTARYWGDLAPAHTIQ